MTVVGVPGDVVGGATLVAQTGGLKTPAETFDQIFTAFLILGTIVGVVVIGYTLKNALKYRDGNGGGYEAKRPKLGEIPTGSGEGKKLALSFTLSALIVLSLITWTYMALLSYETAPAKAQETALEVTVYGNQFSWQFQYADGQNRSTLGIPVDRMIVLRVTSTDVFHNFGIPDYRVKADAIPGHMNSAWFVAEEPGTTEAICYEICGAGHSQMRSDVKAMPEGEYQTWLNDTKRAQ